MAEDIIKKIFEKAKPEIIVFSEFDVNSSAGSYVIESLKERNYFCIYPNNYTYISENYSSIVLTFANAKRYISSEESLGIALKWNEILYEDYRIVGVHIPDSRYEQNRAITYWMDLTNHYKKHKNEKVLYIGDMNVFADDSCGKEFFNSLLECNAKDGWIETGHTNDGSKDFTSRYRTRIDYAIMSQETLECVKQMENFQEFFQENLSDHSALLIVLE